MNYDGFGDVTVFINPQGVQLSTHGTAAIQANFVALLADPNGTVGFVIADQGGRGVSEEDAFRRFLAGIHERIPDLIHAAGVVSPVRDVQVDAGVDENTVLGLVNHWQAIEKFQFLEEVIADVLTSLLASIPFAFLGLLWSMAIERADRFFMASHVIIGQVFFWCIQEPIRERFIVIAF